MTYELLTNEAIQDALANLDGWQLSTEGDAISRNFKFGSFASAFVFMTRCALVSERLNHHPEWFNVYGRVEVRLTTHAAKGLTQLDIKLASAMDTAARYQD